MAGRFIIRRATLADYQGVMDIGKIFEGRDYLPAKYEKYLKLFNCWVGEIDGEIVGFMAGRLVDGGQTVAMSAGRVKEKYQGYGITPAMLKNTFYQYKGISSVKFEANTVNNLGMSRFGENIKRRYKIITQRDHVELEACAATFKPAPTTPETWGKVRQFDEEDIEQIFKSRETCSRLFPDNRIIPDWYPFRLLPENIPHLFDGRRFWGTKDSSGMVKILTITDYFLSGPRIVFKLCIYGNNNKDIVHHVLKQVHNLSLLVNKTRSSYIWVHILHECSNPNEFLKLFTDCGLRVSDYPVNKMFLLEKEYSPEPYIENSVKLSKI